MDDVPIILLIYTKYMVTICMTCISPYSFT